MEQPYKLAGPTSPSLRDQRDRENNDCIGGLRNPFESVPKVPGAEGTGRRLRRLLERFIDQNPWATDITAAITSGQANAGTCEFPQKHLRLLRRAILRCLHDTSSLPADSGICSAILRAYCRSSGDPDGILADWLETGAPIGILNRITHTGVFPPVAEKDRQFDVDELYSSAVGWQNHPSAESDADKVLELLAENSDKQHGRLFDSFEQLLDAVQSRDVVLNKFGLITKVKHDGRVKYRIIWDLKVSGVNELV